MCSTDLVFLIDTTASMMGHINAAKTQVRNIVDSVLEAFFGDAEVRVAVVGYKVRIISTTERFERATVLTQPPMGS